MKAHQEQSHSCRVCRKCFPSGRSLGGHMRSHMASSSSGLDTEDKPQSSKSYYGLRENPRKSWRFYGSNEEEEEEEEEEGSWSFSDGEGEGSRRRRRSRRVAAIGSCSLSASEMEKEQEDVALCLMMLSRDTTPWTGLGNGFVTGESSDKNSVVFEGKGEFLKGFVRNEVEDDEVERKAKVEDEVYDEMAARGKYECKGCNKVFHSYQALGGHRASHKRGNQSCGSSMDAGVPAKKKVKQHQCLICGKVFGSGQSLGGHKRSHLVVAQEQSPVMSELFDLNLPAPADEASNGDANMSTEMAATAWWVGDSLKHETLVGVTPN